MNKVDSARNLAKKRHRYQKRKDCHTPYFNHLKIVIGNLKELGIKDENILSAGWLHDSIEDTPTDYDELAEKFGTSVANMVAAVTKDTRLPREKREAKYVSQLRTSTFGSKVIKLCDVVANISDLKNAHYTENEKVTQVKNKMKYLVAIRRGLVANRKKIPHLDVMEMKLNSLLEYYGVNPMVLH